MNKFEHVGRAGRGDVYSEVVHVEPGWGTALNEKVCPSPPEQTDTTKTPLAGGKKNNLQSGRRG